MNLALPFPRLQHLAIVKIVSTSWDQRKVWALMREVMHASSQDGIHWTRIETLFTPNYSGSDRMKWTDMEDEVSAKVSGLALPPQIQIRLLNLVRPLGKEIFIYYAYYYSRFTRFARLIACSKPICWTVWGTVDYKSSTQLFVRDESLDVLERYKLACFNCLEDDIRQLFHSIPQHVRTMFIHGRLRPLAGISEEEIIILWTRSVNGNNYGDRVPVGGSFGSFDQHAFNCAMMSCNRAACQHFFEHLSVEEKDEVMMVFTMEAMERYKWSPKLLRQTLPYLWINMKEEQQKQLLEDGVMWVLDCLLYWPWQTLFMKTAEQALPFINNRVFDHVSSVVAELIVAGYKDCNYSQMFQEFWQLCPAHYKNSFLDRKSLAKQLLLSSEEEELVKVILKEATHLQIQRLFRYNNPVITKRLLDFRGVRRGVRTVTKKKI